MELILNVYDAKTKKIAKQHRAETADIMYGTVEDLIEIIDIDKLNDNMEWAKVIIMALKKLKPLLKEVFTELTDEDLKNTKVKELVPLFATIFKYMMSEIRCMSGDAKN